MVFNSGFKELIL